jgi:hypothetical protein
MPKKRTDNQKDDERLAVAKALRSFYASRGEPPCFPDLSLEK